MAYQPDLYGLMRRIIHEETLYLRHWPGQVLDDQDDLGLGRVKVSVPELGFIGDTGMWAYPRMGASMVPPKPESWVEVYFLGGDRRRPVYLPGLSEVAGNVPAAYSDPSGPVLWQDPKTGDSAKYDEGTRELGLAVAELTVGQGTEGMALGATLASYLANLKTWMDTHVHTGVSTGGGASGVTAVDSPAVPVVESEVVRGE